MFCKACQSNDIKKRKNHSHGKSSTAIVTLSCKKCGSHDIEIPRPRFQRRRR